MLLVRTYVAKSEIAGVGCFAAEPIAKGTIVWAFDPLFDRIFGVDQVKALPAVVRELVETYAYLDYRQHVGSWVYCGDNGRFVNHSFVPNILETDEVEYAARDIQPGEEIIADYTQFHQALRGRTEMPWSSRP